MEEGKGPGIVIAHPGQSVELLYTLGFPSNNTLTIGWIINHIFYGANALSNGIMPGYSADIHNNNLIVWNIMMVDHRNDTEHQCVMAISRTTIVNRSDPTLLYVAGKYVSYLLG